jgi:hypothetical protein
MEYTFAEKEEIKSQSKKCLDKMKQLESNTTFYVKKFKGTTVYCKNRDRLEEYEKIL